MTELDEILLEVIRPKVEEGLKFLMLLTKADKLNRSEASRALSIAQLNTAGGEVRLFSALKRQGVDETALLLWQWTHEAADIAPQADVTPLADPSPPKEPTA